MRGGAGKKAAERAERVWNQRDTQELEYSEKYIQNKRNKYMENARETRVALALAVALYDNTVTI